MDGSEKKMERKLGSFSSGGDITSAPLSVWKHVYNKEGEDERTEEYFMQIKKGR